MTTYPTAAFVAVCDLPFCTAEVVSQVSDDDLIGLLAAAGWVQAGGRDFCSPAHHRAFTIGAR